MKKLPGRKPGKPRAKPGEALGIWSGIGRLAAVSAFGVVGLALWRSQSAEGVV
jgi:hypothetical protein